jgi:hypothetical protein
MDSPPGLLAKLNMDPEDEDYLRLSFEIALSIGKQESYSSVSAERREPLANSANPNAAVPT